VTDVVGVAVDVGSRVRRGDTLVRLDDRDVEARIDRFDADLPSLDRFILPGGTPTGASLHSARTVCRRAERHTVEARTATPINEQAIVYLNRLSDLFFVLARWANRQAGVREDTWKPAAAEGGDGASENDNQ